MSKKNKDVQVSILLPADRYVELKAAAKRSGMAFAAFMRNAAYEQVKRQAV